MRKREIKDLYAFIVYFQPNERGKNNECSWRTIGKKEKEKRRESGKIRVYVPLLNILEGM